MIPRGLLVTGQVPGGQGLRLFAHQGAFTRRLEGTGFTAEQVEARARIGKDGKGKGPRHTIWFAREEWVALVKGTPWLGNFASESPGNKTLHSDIAIMQISLHVY